MIKLKQASYNLSLLKMFFLLSYMRYNSIRISTMFNDNNFILFSGLIVVIKLQDMH